MKESSKTWSILIYALVLVTISLTMATIILSTSVTLSLNHNYVNVKSKLSRVINDDARVLFKLAKTLNSNGWGFTDNLSCPQNITMSGTTNSGTISTTLFADESSIYCSWSYLSQPLKLYLNSWSTDFPLAEYNGSIVLLINSWVWKVWSTTFSDGENTIIDFSWYDYTIWELYDDNANSDNYSISSTGSTLYYLNFQDDDALHRKIKFWYVWPWTGFNSIFWNNSKTNRYIDKNIHNWDALNSKIWVSNSGSLYLNIDKSSILYLYKFNKSKYDSFNELKIDEKLDWILTSGEWYIQNIGGTLSLSTASSGRNDYIFDFTANDYALLLKNTTNEVLSYNIKWFDNILNKDLYIVPVDDSESTLLKYLWNSIILDEENRLVYEQKEVVSSK